MNSNCTRKRGVRSDSLSIFSNALFGGEVGKEGGEKGRRGEGEKGRRGEERLNFGGRGGKEKEEERKKRRKGEEPLGLLCKGRRFR